MQKLETSDGHLPTNVKRLRKLSKLEEKLLRIGNDISSLSRFIGAQKLAFRKLVKKYQKWTGSSKLGNRFQESVLYHSKHMGPRGDPLSLLVSQHNENLETIRALFHHENMAEPSSFTGGLTKSKKPGLGPREAIIGSEGPPSAYSTTPGQSTQTLVDYIPKTSAKRQARHKRPERVRKKLGHNALQPGAGYTAKARYWNEFDNDEEGAANEPYTILVNHDEDNMLFSTWSSLRSKVRGIFSFSSLDTGRVEGAAERRHLLDPEMNSSASDKDSDSPLSSPKKSPQPLQIRQYSTFGGQKRYAKQLFSPVAASRDKLLFRLTWTTFLLSALLFVLGAVLEGTGRRKYRTETSAVSILGIVASVVLAVMGFCFTFARHEKSDVASCASALLGMVISCTANAILVVVMVRGVE